MEHRRGWTDQARPCDDLIRRLRTRFAPGGLLPLRAGQTVYPGESHAALGVRSLLAQGRRADLENSDLIATIESRRKARIEDAERFGGRCRKKTRRRFRVHHARVRRPGPLLQKEAALPPNVDPSDSRCSDPEERSRMARVFDQGRNVPRVSSCRSSAGTPTPDAGAASAGNCGAAICFSRRADSPLGLRLRIASLPHIPAEGISLYRGAGPGWSRATLLAGVRRGRRRPNRAASGVAGAASQGRLACVFTAMSIRDPRRIFGSAISCRRVEKLEELI